MASFSCVEEKETFLALFSHRYDYIYAPHPEVGDRPQWQTESRHPLSDRLIQQGAYLYGVRFGAQTQYCLLDIDAGSAYHPQCDPLALSRITEALEPLGLVSSLICTSSYSRGLHLYFPFEDAQNSWRLAIAVTTLLENAGFKCQPGQLEVFPNPKLYVSDGTPNLFNAHRLPLQIGSYLLNEQLEPIQSSHDTFVQQWHHCQQHNVVEAKSLEQVLKQSRRRQHPISGRADKFLNDLNAEIELGWTGRGQTNHLLGRITMRTYIFHHVVQGGPSLNGDALVNEIVSVAMALPGYRDWCGHQHEIYQRTEEWVRCIENSHYFPYGTQRGKYKAKSKPTPIGTVEKTWNEQRSLTAQDKIASAMADLLRIGQLPDGATARFKKLITYGIGGGTLYKYKALWHPDLWKTPQTPQASKREGASATASPATAPHPPSLLSVEASNPLQEAGSSALEMTDEGLEVRNPVVPSSWQQVMGALKQVKSQQNQEARSQAATYREQKSQQERHRYAQKMLDYARSGDPILAKEGLQWLLGQESSQIQPKCGRSEHPRCH